MSPTESGTQSPPLEATGEDRPLGCSSVHRVGEKIPVMKDSEQRQRYFQTDNDDDKKPKANVEKRGESLADKFDQRT